MCECCLLLAQHSWPFHSFLSFYIRCSEQWESLFIPLFFIYLFRHHHHQCNCLMPSRIISRKLCHSHSHSLLAILKGLLKGQMLNFFCFLLKGHTHSFRLRRGVKWQTKRRKKRKLGKAVKNVTHTQKWGQEKLVRLEVSNRQKEKEKKQSSHCSLYSFQAEGIFHSRQSM